MIEAFSNNIFHLSSKESSYIIQVSPNGISQLYFGEKILRVNEALPYLDKADNKEKISLFSLKDVLSFSPSSPECLKRKGIIEMDFPQAKGVADTLEVVFKDEKIGLFVTYIFTVFENSDAYTRRVKVENKKDQTVTLSKIYSSCLVLKTPSLFLTTFKEEETERSVFPGFQMLEENSLFSSSEKECVYLLNNSDGFYLISLLYSGPHGISIKANEEYSYIYWGISENNFYRGIEKDSFFESPEALIIWGKTREEIEKKNKDFIKTSLMRGSWKSRIRPVMATTSLFSPDVNEKKVKSLSSSKLPFDGIIIDDGWFGNRRTENDSMGDWVVDPVKFPSGLASISDYLHSKNLLFGLFFAPEIVNRKSFLYDHHKNWVLSEAEDKMLLNLANEEVVSWIVSFLSDTIKRCSLDYLRWYMDINITLESGVAAYMYIKGFYKALREIGKSFPDLYIELSGGRIDSALVTLSSTFLIKTPKPLYPLCLVEKEIKSEDDDLFFSVPLLLINAEEKSEKLEESLKLYQETRDILQFGQEEKGKNYRAAFDANKTRIFIEVKEDGIIKIENIERSSHYTLTEGKDRKIITGEVLKIIGIPLKKGVYLLEKKE